MKKFPYKLFKLDTFGYCGLLMRESTMKKVVKLQAKYVSELKKLLSEESGLVPYSWVQGWDSSLGGEAVYLNYVDSHSSVEDRIDLFKIPQPELVECVDSTDYRAVSEFAMKLYHDQNKKDNSQ